MAVMAYSVRMAELRLGRQTQVRDADGSA